MTVFVEYLDGSVYSTDTTSWDEFPKTGAELIGMYPTTATPIFLDGDVFFFTDVGVSFRSDGTTRWVSRVIGAFDSETDKGVVVECPIEGSPIYSDAKLSEYMRQYSPMCFIKGME